MSKGVRIAIMLALIFFIGAWQNVVPLFESQAQGGRSSTSTRIDFSYESNQTTLASTQTSEVWVSDYSDVEQGSFFIQSGDTPSMLVSPLISSKVEMDVNGLIARVKLQQRFVNTTEKWVNGIYVFPLPEDAAVDHLTMQIGARTIEGQIQPREKAKAIYEQAKREGKKASLLAQQRPNLFTNSVANIGPSESIIVTIEYQQKVQFAQGEFSLRLPTTVAQRFIPSSASTAITEVNQQGWSIRQPTHHAAKPLSKDSSETPTSNALNIQVDLNMGFELDKVVSSSHPIKVSKQAQGYSVSLTEQQGANRDFVLRWYAKKSASPQAAHFYQQTDQGHYGMLMLMPSTEPQEPDSLAREVVFVLDTSGSMQGESMLQAQLALQHAIQQLSDNDWFNVIEFDSESRPLWSQVQLANIENKQLAGNFVEHLSADGGTQMLSALQLALDKPTQSKQYTLRQVVFITDGAVGNEAELFGFIQDHVQHSRLFTVGIGSAPNSFFMTEAAKMGKGTFTYISAADQVQEQMNSLFEQLRHPVITDVLARFSQHVEYYPKNIPDLYQAEPLILTYKSTTPVDEMMVSGTYQQGYWSQQMQLDKGAAATGLDVAWARNKIADLERGKRMGEDKQTTDQAITDVAMAHHLISSQTSLVAVDVTPTATQISQDVAVRSLAPKGQNVAGILPQTATPAALYSLLGWCMLGGGICSLYMRRGR